MKRKKVIYNVILNICASAVPVAILQLFIYPILARNMETDHYGLMLTVYSAWMMISNSLGNVLNNIRLLYATEYEERNLSGDFPVILFRWSWLNILVIFFLAVFYLKETNIFSIILYILVAVVILLKSYLEVEFRIRLDYVAVLVNNILQGIGFLAGMLLFQLTNLWQFVFLFGNLFSLFFILSKGSLKKEPYIRTELYSKIKRDSSMLIIATFGYSIMSYSDKLVLYPLMGGYAVSVYYTATIVGKIVGMLSSPITSVILSYISKWDKNNKEIFSKVLAIGGIVSLLGYGITIAASRIIISVLFPQWTEDVMIYLPVTTVAVVVQALNALLSPFVLKFYDMKWQIVINITSALVYFIGAFLLWKSFGLMGFCVGTIIGHLAMTAIMCGLHLEYKMRNKKRIGNNKRGRLY